MSMQNYHLKPKQSKPFSFAYPIVNKMVVNLRIQNVHVCDLIIEGSATLYKNASTSGPLDERYSVDIDFVKLNGADITPVIEHVGLMDEIREAAYTHCTDVLFNPENIAA